MILVNCVLLSIAYLLTTKVEATSVIDIAIGVGMKIIGSGGGSDPNSVSFAGDFNADGHVDYILGAPSDGAAGTAYLFLGSDSETDIDTESFTSGSSGMKILGASAGDNLGFSVGAAGDINDDGFDDCLVGAPNAGVMFRGNAGIVYAIFGRAGPYTDLLLSAFTAGNLGFKIVGDASGTHLGECSTCLRGALGDVNGDGIDDFAIGSPNSAFLGREEAGVVYIIYGKPSDAPVTNYDLADDLGSSGTRVGGETAGDHLGSSLSGIGDVNGDGNNDLLIGCPDCDALGRTDAGVTFLLFSTSGTDLADCDGTTCVRIVGGAEGDHLGQSTCACGDFNGDGIADIVLGAPGTDVDGVGADAGCVHVIYGSDTMTSTFDTATQTTADAGFMICGPTAGAMLGTAVSSAGDVNGDGIDDLLIGAGGNNGGAFVVPGLSGARDDVDLRTELNICIIIAPTEDSKLGLVLDGGADVTGDGNPDMLLAVLGATYVVECPADFNQGGGPSVPSEMPSAGPVPTTNPGVPTAKPVKGPPPHPVSAPASGPTMKPVKGPPPHPVSSPVNGPTMKPVKGPPPHPVSSPVNGPTMKPVKGPPPHPNHAPTAKPVKGPPPHPNHAPTAKPVKGPPPHPVSSPVNGPTMKPVKGPPPHPVSSPVNGPTMKPVKGPPPHPVSSPVNGPTMKPVKGPPPHPVSSPVKGPPPHPVRAPSPAPTVKGQTNAPTTLQESLLPTLDTGKDRRAPPLFSSNPKSRFEHSFCCFNRTHTASSVSSSSAAAVQQAHRDAHRIPDQTAYDGAHGSYRGAYLCAHRRAHDYR
jgi:hypothetical protein